MEDRILVVEDYMPNMVSALMAFHEDDNIEDIIVHGKFEDARRSIGEFRPTVALLDININGGGTGRDIGKILKQQNIPYVYVTGVGPAHGDQSEEFAPQNLLYAIEIKMEEENGLTTLASFEACEKDPEIWRKAYELLRGRKGKAK